jgi:hypothetical protein
MRDPEEDEAAPPKKKKKDEGEGLSDEDLFNPL